MEKWKTIMADKLKNKKFKTFLTMGEDKGLCIELSNSDILVKLVFGNAQAVRFLDEGLVQQKLYDDVYIGDKIISSFNNVLYEVENGEFMNFLNDISFDMAKQLKMKHYIIITQNYNIEILTQWEPDIIIE